jgi:hypothetical protein
MARKTLSLSGLLRSVLICRGVSPWARPIVFPVICGRGAHGGTPLQVRTLLIVDETDRASDATNLTGTRVGTFRIRLSDDPRRCPTVNEPGKPLPDKRG